MSPSASQTFLFADLAGFTALTEAHGDERAADLVDDFVGQARAVMGAYDATEVKAIGDALMLRAPDAAQGVLLARRLATEIGGQHGFPGIRVGVHTGPAVARGADWFGAAVNLASRVSGAAIAGQVLVTEATRLAALDDLPQCEFRYAGEKRFKNVRDPVRAYAVVETSSVGPVSAPLSIDPVCRMAVDRERSEVERHYRGVEYRFCSAACARAFDAQPEHYHGQRSSRGMGRRGRRRWLPWHRWPRRGANAKALDP
ncbi:MAG: adenylate/guanylate cyclase domain-containing protein [Candidatus Limnocylindrales bacterium]